MTLWYAEQELKSLLRKIYSPDEAAAIAALAMEAITGFSNAERRRNSQLILDENQRTLLSQMQNRLLQNEPVQYVLGKALFCNLQLHVNASVLIPRPETEELVQWILEEKKQRPIAKILDVGTGSGCIAIAIKKNWQEAEVFGLDVSEAALELAAENARAQKTNVHWWQANILQPQQWPTDLFDLIVSNPPYILETEMDQLEKNVKDWEPHLALFVPDNDPLLFYRRIAEFASKHLHSNGSLYFECHHQQAAEVLRLLNLHGFEAAIKKDLFGKDRMVKAVGRA
jgi:release factor glutamine methyltransferase